MSEGTFAQDLSQISYWGIGGFCKNFHLPDSVSELAIIVKEYGSNFLVIGGGTNILFDSAGVDRPIIKLGRNGFDYIIRENNILRVGGAAWTPEVVYRASRMGLEGIDHCIGIPATVGGLVMMNGGSQRRSISESLLSITVMTCEGSTKVIPKSGLDFGYRLNSLKNEKVIITEVALELKQCFPRANRSNLLSILKSRRERFPRKTPNCGSVFLSDPKLYEQFGPPGLIIEKLGFKGFCMGGAQVSEQHANFIVNNGGATSDDILKIIKSINDSCYQKNGFSLKAEAIYISKAGFISSLDEAARNFV